MGAQTRDLVTMGCPLPWTQIRKAKPVFARYQRTPCAVSPTKDKPAKWTCITTKRREAPMERAIDASEEGCRREHWKGSLSTQPN